MTPLISNEALDSIRLSTSTLTSLISVEDAKYNVSDASMVALAKCESSLNNLAINHADPEGGSIGLFQFQPSTFYGFAKRHGIEDPDIGDPIQQADLAAWMVSQGYGPRWSCWKVVDNIGLQ